MPCMVVRMNKIALGLVAACLSALAQNSLTPEEKKAGWILLFDGKTMNNWVDPRQKTPPGDAWTIDDGCLKATRHAKITEDLFSQGTYRDFELEFDWRISPAGNSGVKYRIQDRVPLIDEVKGVKFRPPVRKCRVSGFTYVYSRTF